MIDHLSMDLIRSPSSPRHKAYPRPRLPWERQKRSRDNTSPYRETIQVRTGPDWPILCSHPHLFSYALVRMMTARRTTGGDLPDTSVSDDFLSPWSGTFSAKDYLRRQDRPRDLLHPTSVDSFGRDQHAARQTCGQFFRSRSIRFAHEELFDQFISGREYGLLRGAVGPFLAFVSGTGSSTGLVE